MRQRAFVIVNPVAGSGESTEVISRVKKLLHEEFSLEIAKTTRERNGLSLAKTAIEDGFDVILAAGGDGTITQVANALIGTDVSFGILPTGTANALFGALFEDEIILDPIGRSCDAILAGSTSRIDTVRYSQGNMLLLAGVGIEAGMVEKADRELKKKFGPFAYLMGSWEQLHEQEEFKVQLDCDGVSRQIRTGSLVIANAAPKTSLFAMGRGQPEPADGLLDITAVVGVETTWETIQAIAALFHAGLTKSANGGDILHIQSKKVRISCTPEQKLVVDGEITDSTPEEFEINPGSLKIFAPAAP